MAFRGLQADSVAQGEFHRGIAKDLETLVLDPFSDWSTKHKDRIHDCRTVMLDEWVRAYEHGQSDVSILSFYKLLHHLSQYCFFRSSIFVIPTIIKIDKLMRLKMSEYVTSEIRVILTLFSAKFAPNAEYEDKFTPRIKTNQNHGVVNRTASVSERISQQLSALKQTKLEGKEVTSPSSPQNKQPKVIDITHSPEAIEKQLPPADKGKGREADETGPPAPPKVTLQPVSAASAVVLAGISLTEEELGKLITKAKAELPLRPIRFPIIGEYQNCFSGFELVAWLKGNVLTLGDNEDKAELFARDLTERENALRRLGELGT